MVDESLFLCGKNACNPCNGSMKVFQIIILIRDKPSVGLDIFFGGMDYQVEYQKLALFAGVTKERARGLEVLTRPILPNGTIVQVLTFNDDVGARASDSQIPGSGVESSF